MRCRAGIAGSAAWGVVFLLLAGSVQAQGWIEPGRPGAFAVVKVRTNVRVTVHERVAQVEVEEWFRNDGPPFGEADYIYPLPPGASFTNYSLWQGDEELRGEMMDAGEARRIYEEIVRSKRDPALIELVGHGLMRARVFPIATGETRRIALRYTQVLPRAADALEFRYAAGGRNPGGIVVAPPVRPLPRPGERPMDARIEQAERSGRPPADAAPLAFTLTVEDGARFRDPFSPTHEVRVTRERGRLVVRSAERLAGDFALFLPFAENPVGITLATHRASRSEDGYFMVTLSPAAVQRAARVPRDITAVVDVSGSMSGEKLDQAQRALHHLLDTLEPTDRVRLIRFEGSVATWRPGWEQATPEVLREARAWVDDLQAQGGTNISGALEEAFAETSPRDRLGVVVFLTDGLPSVGERDPERIAELAERERGEARVFAFGVGYDVNTYLLDRLSAAARGTTQYVAPEEDVESAVGTLAARIRHPVLTDIALGVVGARVSELYPRELPDLFAGEELVLFGRYEPEERSTITLTGQRAGRTERYHSAASFTPHEPGNDWIPRLWATRKVGQLTRELRLHGHDAELIEEIQRTALRYGVLSEYTAYLVQEPGMVMAGNGAARDEALQALAPPPAAATGQVAVESSKAAQRQRGVASAAELRVMEESQAVRAPAADASAARVVSGRTFVLREGVWEDVLTRRDARAVHVRAFSPAYFALLAELPELLPYARELTDVQVTGSEVMIRITGLGGAEQLSAAELRRAVADFRGAARATR